jgi:threonine synthase
MIVATNSNDILHRFFANGAYEKHPVEATCAPSMDIGISSNFERYLFYLFGSDPATLAGMMETFKSTGKLSVSPSLLEKARGDFLSASASESQIAETVSAYNKKHGYLLCPHSACGVAAVDQLRNQTAWSSEEKHEMVVLATAHPGKFNEAVEKIIGSPPILPPQLAAVQNAQTRCMASPNSIQAIRSTIVETIAGREGKKVEAGGYQVEAQQAFL